MLAYAASRPVAVDRRPHPNAMLMIIGVHVAVIAAVMSAKMEIDRHRPPPIVIDTIPLPKPPPPNTPVRHPTRPEAGPTSYPQSPVGPQPLPRNPGFPTQPTADPGPIGPTPVPIPEPRPLPTPVISSGPQLLTPSSELKPPYPASKLLSEEEAVLKLRLTIDEHGRVVAVDPVGRADPAFLEAARRHLLAHWRYKPAMDDGRAVTSSEVITLHFELNG